MLPNSKIKEQLKKKFSLGTQSNDKNLAGNNKEVLKSIKNTAILAPDRSTPGSVSILSFLKTQNKKDSGDKFLDMNPIKYYHYPIEFLDKNISNLDHKNKTVNICIYSVYTETSKPYLMYLLHKKNDTFIWPKFISKGDVINECKSKLVKLEISDDVKFEGYIKNNDSINIFYKLTENFDYNQNLRNETPFLFATMYEILFSRKIMYFNIDKKVIDIFITERRLQYLLDKQNLLYQLPIVMYNGAPSHKLDFYLEAGLLKAPPIKSSQGPYYYFANYMRAAKFGSWNVMGGYKEIKVDNDVITDNQYGRYIKGGIIRFIVYPGKSKVIMNRSWDKKNDQIDKKNLTEDMKKIYDTKGSWVKDYDSVLLGPLKIGNNKVIHNGTSLTVKSYYQYKSLSYHYLDKKTIPEQYTPDLDEKYYDLSDNKYFKIE